jgi:lipid A 4'-phosphatase
MNRTALWVALGLGAVVGLVFGIDAQLDIGLERPFYDAGIGFLGPHHQRFDAIRDLARVIITIVLAPALIAVAGKLILPHRPMLIPGRAALLMIVTLALAPGILANLILKPHWGRPRPVDITEFGGDLQFVPWWDPRGTCPENCSFVAGEPSGAFWTLAPAALVPPTWRAPAYAAALAFGAGMGLVRMIEGGHFFTDVVFSGLFTFLIIWLVHGLLYRWPATRFSDRVVEWALERLSFRFWVDRLRRMPHQPAGGDEGGA